MFWFALRLFECLNLQSQLLYLGATIFPAFKALAENGKLVLYFLEIASLLLQGASQLVDLTLEVARVLLLLILLWVRG